MRRARLSAAVFVLAAVAASMTIGTHAYATFGRWSVTPVVMYINPANGDVPAQAAEAALQAGMDIWNTQPGSSFRFVYGGRVADTTTGNDGKSVIIFRNESSGSTLASTYSWSSNGSLVDSDIVFWDAGFTFFTGASGCSSGAYIEDVAAHELGHALGLSHSDQSDATMYPTYGWCSQEWRSLSADDIAGVTSLYPAASTTQVPSAPSGVSVSTVSASSLAISWSDNSNNESGFRLERSSDGIAFMTLSQPGGNVRSYTDNGLSSATRYYYRVAAYNSAGSSAYSNIGSGVTAATATNSAPAISISSPVGGASYLQGASITFSGSASDTQDGNLTASMTWSSNLDGALGSGSGFSRTLSTGTHTITARVTDSGGLSASKQVSLTVTVSSTAGPALAARGYKVRGSARVDLTWAGLTAANVDVYRNGTKIAASPNDGAETDTLGKRAGGSYIYKVCETGTATCSNEASVTF